MFWKCGAMTLDLGTKPLIMGIVNVTPDSFSDHHPGLALALKHGLALAADGADILDIGGESTRPGSTGVDLKTELERVIPVIRALRRECDLPLSVDTQKPAVALAALEAGAQIVNHVSASLDWRAMAPVIAKTGAGYVAMHMRDRPKTMQRAPHYSDVTAEVSASLQRLCRGMVAEGVGLEQLVFDPGIGFGKQLGHNLSLLRDASGLAEILGRPLLVGLSRKSWLRHLFAAQHGGPSPAISNEELDAYTVLATSQLPFPRVAIHRVHNVAMLKNSLLLLKRLSAS